MRILIVSDIHSNPFALRAVADDAGAVDHVLCCGDCVNYGTRPLEVIAWLQARGAIVVRGNHDDAVAFNHHPHASPAKAHLAVEIQKWTASQLDSVARSWLTRLPLSLTWEIGGARFFLAHATPVDPLYDYRLTPDADFYLLNELVGSCRAEFVCLGHTHYPLVRQYRGMTILNPGSVGQPLDGDPRASYAIWDDGKITLHRVTYPYRQMITTLGEMYLPDDLEQSLRRSFELGKMT
ncbi:MAG: metallophosphoesterase family protein [Phycisphaerae bacterium]